MAYKRRRRFRYRARRVYRNYKAYGYRAVRRIYSVGRTAQRGFINLRPMHRHMLAGAVVMLVVFLMMPKARSWLLETWFKLGLPAPKGGE